MIAINQLAHALAASPERSVRDERQAVQLAERAVQISGDQDPVYLDTLAIAYAAAGRFSYANSVAHRALELATHENRSQLAGALTARLRLYEAQQPYRDA